MPEPARPPTSHERQAGQAWDASYRDGQPPWDIGRPQPAIVQAAKSFTGPVLDVGCGTGENALHVAGLGLPVLGVDVAETAIEQARTKAADRNLPTGFETADVLDLHLGRRFATVLDCGLFHTLDAGERPRYLASLAGVTEAGSVLCLLCFRDVGEGSGPHPVAEADLRATFSDGWRITSLDTTRIETRMHEFDAPAWLMAAIRTVS